MTETHPSELMNQWHRRFAVDCNNLAWDLAEKESHTPAEADEMLCAAYAAAFHWAKIGRPIHRARADQTLAHVHALLGHATLALTYARRCLDFCENNTCEPWDLAFAHAVLAHAAAAAGDNELHARHYAIARTRGIALVDDEERDIFATMFASVPAQVIPA